MVYRSAFDKIIIEALPIIFISEGTYRYWLRDGKTKCEDHHIYK